MATQSRQTGVWHISEGVAWQFSGQFAQAGKAGRVPGILLLVGFLVSFVLRFGWLGFFSAMVFMRSKAIASKSVPSQKETSKKDTSVQTAFCEECLGLSVVPVDVLKGTCLRCEQVNDLLSLVAELKEEVERLRSIRESEREIDWWSFTLPSLREVPQQSEHSHASHHQAEGGDLGNEGEWKGVPTQGRNKNSSRPPSPPQLPQSSSLCTFHLSFLGRRSLSLAASAVSQLVSASFVHHCCEFSSLFLARLHSAP